MAEFTEIPDFVIEEEPIFDTLISEHDLGIEQRRSRRNDSIRRWRLRFFNRTQTELDTIRDFFIAKKGAFSHFTWVNPNDNVEYYVRFEKDSLTFRYKQYNVYDVECIFLGVLYWSTTSSTSTTSTTSTSTSTTSTSTSSTTSTSTTTTTI